MPLQKLQFRPGLNREGTDYSNEGGWYDGDKIRFRSGFPEKIGGWSRLSNDTYLGVARALWNWIDLDGSNYLGVGTNIKYYIEKGGQYNDITPYTQIDSLSGAFSATSGSSTITVTDGTYNPSVGDYVVFSGAASLGGNITAAVLNQEYVVATVTSPTTYTIEAKNNVTGAPVLANASDTGTGGASIVASYEVPVGSNVFTTGVGWGAGPWSPTTVYTTPTTTAISTTNGSSTVTITHNSHGLSTGNYVSIVGASTVGGIPASMLNTTYAITVTGASAYTITLPASYAGSFVTGAKYVISFVGTTDFTLIGAAANTIGTAFTATGPGTGTGQATFAATSTTTGGGSFFIYPQSGTRGWGAAYTGAGIGTQLRLWSNDNYGQNLVIAPRGGEIYYWQDSFGVSTRAVKLSTLSTAYFGPTNYVYSTYTYGQYVPTKTNQVVASAIQRFIIAMGANSFDETNPNTVFDPMLVRWSDQEDPYQWVPAVTNQAGEFRLSNGSYIVGARATRQEILVWTDSCIYSMQYLGAPYVWGFNILMDNISVMSPNAMITVNNVTYWMGTDKFYMYSGRVETLPCALRQYIFNDINKDQAFQIFAGANEGFNEVWWFYVSNSSAGTTIDKYVIYNYLDRVWYYGSMARSAWLDSGIRQYPMAADYNNRILYHESSVDDNAGATSLPITAYVQSSDFDIGDGHNFGFVWRILPDVNFNGSSVNQPYVTMTVKPRQNSGTPYGTADNPTVTSADNYGTRGTYNIQEFTGQVYTRLRGRQMSFRIESDSLGVAWQLGSPRIDIRNDGRR